MAMSVQYRVAIGKKEELVSGADQADIVITVPHAVAVAHGFDATVEFMRGRLKASGHTGDILDLLKSGAVTRAVADLVTTTS